MFSIRKVFKRVVYGSTWSDVNNNDATRKLFSATEDASNFSVLAQLSD